MEERDLPAAPHAGATPAERAAFGQGSIAQPAGNNSGLTGQGQASPNLGGPGQKASGQPGPGQPTPGQSGRAGPEPAQSGGTPPQQGRATQDQSGNLAGDAAQAATDAAGRVTNLARDAFDSAATAASSVRDRVVGSAQQQQNAAADQVDSLANTLRRTADSLPENQGWLSDLTQKGGQQLSDLADTLRRNDLQGLLHKVDGFARNQPALFLGASMAAGFALARVAQVSVAQLANGSPGSTTGGRARPEAGGSSPSAAPPPEYRTTITEGPMHPRTDNSSPYAGTGERRSDNTEANHG